MSRKKHFSKNLILRHKSQTINLTKQTTSYKKLQVSRSFTNILHLLSDLKITHSTYFPNINSKNSLLFYFQKSGKQKLTSKKK